MLQSLLTTRIMCASLQVMMNPFFTFSSKITSASFHQKLKQQARLYFR